MVAVMRLRQTPFSAKRSVPPARRPNAETRTREHLTPDEIEQLMDGVADGRLADRDRLLIMMAYRHGLRASEMCALRWDQINLKAGLLHDRVTHLDAIAITGADASVGWRCEKKHFFNGAPDRPIQLAPRPLASCNGIFVVCSSCIRRHPQSTLPQPSAEDVVRAIAAETNTPAEPASKMQPTRELPYDALHQLVIVAEHAGRWAYIFRR